MLKVIIPVIIFLHGAVHIWYVLLIGNIVKFSPDMGWTGKSWLLPGMPVEGIYRILGVIVYGLSAIMFIVSASGMLMNKSWYPAGLLVAAFVSSIAILFFFDGRFHMLVQKGMIGLILNSIIITTIIVKFYS
jgi:hypothetical protein